MTGYSTVLIGPEGDRTIMIYRGANNFIDPDDIKMKNFKNYKAFLFTSITGEKSLEAHEKAVRYAEKKNLTIIANPSITMIRRREDGLQKMIKKSNIIIMNEEEALRFTRSRKILTAIEKLIIGKELVVVTMGERGVVAFDGTKKYRQHAFNTRVTDATGAGDAFTSGFIMCYLQKMAIPQCLRFGAANSALLMQNFGATNNYPTKTNIIRKMGSG
jgi:sugar/nucleoside kinase (ribokinase family)